MLIHSHKVAKRGILIVAGFTLLVAGLVMSVLLVPGPGLLVVVAALAILAVEIDICAGCKGLWSDANELDHILASKDQTGPLRKFLKVLGK